MELEMREVAPQVYLLALIDKARWLGINGGEVSTLESNGGSLRS